MFKTNLGAFNGKSWEELCQLVFKAKYGCDGYQPIPASPGDFGLEGFTMATGQAFQCYCPDKHYDSKALYEAQRDKITVDLGKLKKNQSELQKRLGTTIIKSWLFVTPVIDENKLLAHAKLKEQEVKSWKLPFVDPDFSIHLRDADFYLKEISEVRTLTGVPLNFDTTVADLPAVALSNMEYEANLLRKSERRVGASPSDKREASVKVLYESTLQSFLSSDAYLKRIEEAAPTVHARILRIVNEFGIEVAEKGATWTGTPQQLNDEVKEGLADRIIADLSTSLDSHTAHQISRHLVARWLAICQLDFN